MTKQRQKEIALAIFKNRAPFILKPYKEGHKFAIEELQLFAEAADLSTLQITEFLEALTQEDIEHFQKVDLEFAHSLFKGFCLITMSKALEKLVVDRSECEKFASEVGVPVEEMLELYRLNLIDCINRYFQPED